MYTEKQFEFIKVLYSFSTLTYSQFNQLWKNISGVKTKISSQLLKQLEQDGLMNRVLEKGKIRNAIYCINQNEILKKLKSIAQEPLLKSPERANAHGSFHEKQIKSPNFYQEALKELCIPFVNSKTTISFDEDKIPNVCLVSEKSIVYLMLDEINQSSHYNLNIIQSNLKLHKQKTTEQIINLVFIFMDDTVNIKGFVNNRTSPPYDRIQKLSNEINGSGALSKTPLLTQLMKQERLNIHFFTYKEAMERLDLILKGEYLPDLKINSNADSQPDYKSRNKFPKTAASSESDSQKYIFE